MSIARAHSLHEDVKQQQRRLQRFFESGDGGNFLKILAQEGPMGRYKIVGVRSVPTLRSCELTVAHVRTPSPIRFSRPEDQRLCPYNRRPTCRR
jgi:hypothetical protein